MKFVFLLLCLYQALSLQLEDIYRFPDLGGCGISAPFPIGPGRMDACPGGLCSYVTFTGDLIRVDEDGNCASIANFASLVDPNSFTLGYIYDDERDTHLLVNGGGGGSSPCATGCIIAVPDDTLVPEIFLELSLGGMPNFFSGVHITKRDWLLITVEITGGVYAVDLDTKNVVFNTDFLLQATADFATLPDGSPNPAADIDNLNVYGLPLGANGITCHRNGRTCWISVLHERRLVEADFDKSSGVLSNYRTVLPVTVDGAEARDGGFTFEGMYYDKRTRTILASSVFEDVDDVRNTKPGNAIFIVDPDEQTTRRIDGPFGMSLQVLPGSLFNRRYDYIVSVSGLDSGNFWPCGNLAQGGDLPCSPDFFTTPDFHNAAFIGVCEGMCD